jgi:TDG/mug DNA glycosylase family protein
MMEEPWRPTKAQLEAARGRTLADVLAPGLDMLFCGINPSVYSAAVGHHFARPGNRFWPSLHAGGFTERLLSPFEDRSLLEIHLGLTNFVARATPGADELTDAELRAGARRLRAKVEKFRPRVVAFLGVGAYRVGFGQPDAGLGKQPELLAGAVAWVLPSPSGRNAHYKPADLARLFAEMRAALADL